MDSSAPPWRVFDAPGDATGTPTGTVAARHDGPPGPDHASAGAGAMLSSLAPSGVALGLMAAVAGLALAVALAVGGPGGDVTIDASSDHLLAGDVASGSPGGEVVVDVAGAVLRPGVYHLAATARIGDAIAAAGGYGPRVAVERVDRELNLAAPIHDGELIVVPSRDDVPAATPAGPGGDSPGGGSPGGSAKVDLNHATEAELESLPGIGPVTAGKIIAARTEAPFTSVDDLLTRKLVGQKTFDSLQSLVTVG